MHIIVAADAGGTLLRAKDVCAAEREAHQQTIAVKDHIIPDEYGYSFVVGIRSCLAGKTTFVPPEEEAVLVSEAGNLTAFDTCVEEIRARPTPSHF
ncbi:hypothetical protein ACQPYV_33825 [Micromonospora saelicesensis]|uniref:hypothetical protein n=1 Tax=Micromonospora saelicesensis TaxID=285676 RepID=UPI003D8A6068